MDSQQFGAQQPSGMGAQQLDYPLKKRTLAEMIDRFKRMDDDQPVEDFKPEEEVGDIKDKIDAIKWRIDSWEAEAEALQTQWIDQLLARKRTMLAKAERLKDWVRYQMVTANFETLPGEMFRVDLRDSPAAVEVGAEPSATWYIEYPQFMQLKTTYTWNKKVIKDALLSGIQPGIPATLKQSKHVRFIAKKG